MNQSIVRPSSKEDLREHICISTLQGIHKIALSDILYIKGDGSYCVIHKCNGKSLIVSKLLKQIGGRISNNSFIRVHHSFIVNRSAVAHMQFGLKSKLVLSDGTRIPISRSKKEFIKNNLSQYIIQ